MRAPFLSVRLDAPAWNERASRAERSGSRRSATRGRCGPASRCSSREPRPPRTARSSASADPYVQTARAIGNVSDALSEAGASLSEVVRTRLFVTDIDDWEAVGRAHSEAFGDVRPATSMVEVQGLIDPEMIVEIEAVAVVGSGPE